MSSGGDQRSLKPGRPKIECTPRPSSMGFDAVAAATRAIPSGRARHRARDAWLAAVRADMRLSRAARLVAHELAAILVWIRGYSRISIGELAQRCGCCRSTARRALRDLRLACHLVRQVERRPGSAEAEVALTGLPGIAEAHRRACGQPAGYPQGVGAQVPPGGGVDAPTVGAQVSPGRGVGAPTVGAQVTQSPLSPSPVQPLDIPLESVPRAGARARDATTSDSPKFDVGLTVPADSARPAFAVGAPGLAAEALPSEWPFGLDSELAAKVRRRGIEPQPVWSKIVSRNAERIRKGKGPLQVDNWAGYVIGTAEKMVRERLGPADPSELARYRASRGPSWRPRGR